MRDVQMSNANGYYLLLNGSVIGYYRFFRDATKAYHHYLNILESTQINYLIIAQKVAGVEN